MAEVLGNLEPEEVMAIHPEAGGEVVDTQSFAFDTREKEPPTEALVEQPVEATQGV